MDRSRRVHANSVSGVCYGACRAYREHPSVAPPVLPGRDGIGDAWRFGVAVTGVTIHLVDAGIDSGRILAQRAVEIFPEDSLENLEEKIHTTEHALYWKTLSELFQTGVPAERRWRR